MAALSTKEVKYKAFETKRKSWKNLSDEAQYTAWDFF